MNNFQKETDATCLKTEKCASDWMKAFNELMKRIYEKSGILQVIFKKLSYRKISISFLFLVYFCDFSKWNFNTNINDENEQKVTDFALMENKFQKLTKRTAEKFRK